MNFFSKLFKKEKPVEVEFSPFLGGNGMNSKNPVFINCASSAMANSLMDKFISEKHGIKNTDWNQTMSMSLNSDITECGIIKSISIKSKDESFVYYFDLSRPMKNPI